VVPFEISMLTSSWYLFWYISWMITNKRYMENIRTLSAKLKELCRWF
jgi:di/tricarboxylate transporter